MKNEQGDSIRLARYVCLNFPTISFKSKQSTPKNVSFAVLKS